MKKENMLTLGIFLIFAFLMMMMIYNPRKVEIDEITINQLPENKENYELSDVSGIKEMEDKTKSYKNWVKDYSIIAGKADNPNFFVPNISTLGGINFNDKPSFDRILGAGAISGERRDQMVLENNAKANRFGLGMVTGVNPNFQNYEYAKGQSKNIFRN